VLVQRSDSLFRQSVQTHNSRSQHHPVAPQTASHVFPLKIEQFYEHTSKVQLVHKLMVAIISDRL